MNEQPLIRHYQPSAPVLYLADGSPLSQSRFLGQVIALARRWPTARHVINLCEDRHHFLAALAAALLRGVVTLLPPSRGADHLASLQRLYPGATVIGDIDLPAADPWCDAPPRLPANRPLLTVFTSGSTGTPQAHSKTWASLGATLAGSSRSLGLDRPFALLATVPTQHMYGLETAGLMPLLGHAASHVARPFFPADIMDVLRTLPAPRVLVTTPVHLRALVGASISPPPLEMVMSATAPLERGLAAQAEAVLGAPVREIYGCSETASIAARRTVTDQAWTLYDGFTVEPTADGAIVRGPALDTAFHVADRIELVGENGFRLLGRSGDLVNVAGKRCSLSELTRVLQSLSGVEDAVVFLPSESASRPAALVVAPMLTEAQLRKALSNHVDAVFVPRPLRRVAHLPRNELGKLPHAQLVASLEALP